MMSRYGYGVLLIAGLALARAGADAPEWLRYQGHLVNVSGQAVTGELEMAVALFDAETGGTMIHSQHIGQVRVDGGAYAFNWGGAGLTDALTNDACWLQVHIDGDAMTPRERLDAVPYARRARIARQTIGPQSGAPHGGIALWSGALVDIPAGWALCNGANGTPDLRGRFVMGAAAGADPGATGGADSYILSTAQMPSHTHTASSGTAGSHTHTASSGSAGAHTHSGSTSSAGGHAHTFRVGNCYGYVSYHTDYSGGRGSGGGDTSFRTHDGGSHAHSLSSVSTAGDHSHTVTVNAGGAHTHTVSTTSTGGGEAIDNRPAFYALAFIMKL